MIIFFIDGELTNDVCQSAADEVERNNIDMIFYIDATEGPTRCYKQLETAKELSNTYIVAVLTNFTGAMEGKFSWNDDIRCHSVLFPYRRNWSMIKHFTERELRQGHNIPHMYITGVFDYDPREAGFDNDF